MPKSKKKTYHHGDLRNSLIDAAITLVRKQGPNAFSMRELAKQAGVSHAAPYRHFSDKNALFSAIAEIGFQRLAVRMQEAISNNPDNPRQQLLDAGVHYVELATENPEITQLMFGGFIDKNSCSESLTEQADHAFNGLLTIVQNGQDAGLYQKKSSLDLALAVWSLAHGLSMLITGGQLAREINTKNDVTEKILIVENILLQGMLK